MSLCKPTYKYRIISLVSEEWGFVYYLVQSKKLSLVYDDESTWVNHGSGGYTTSLELAKYNLDALKTFRARAEAHGVKVEYEE